MVNSLDIKLLKLNEHYKDKKISKTDYLKGALPILKEIVENNKESYPSEIYKIHLDSYTKLRDIAAIFGVK